MSNLEADIKLPPIKCDNSLSCDENNDNSNTYLNSINGAIPSQISSNVRDLKNDGKVEKKAPIIIDNTKETGSNNKMANSEENLAVDTNSKEISKTTLSDKSELKLSDECNLEERVFVEIMKNLLHTQRNEIVDANQSSSSTMKICATNTKSPIKEMNDDGDIPFSSKQTPIGEQAEAKKNNILNKVPQQISTITAINDDPDEQRGTYAAIVKSGTGVNNGDTKNDGTTSKNLSPSFLSINAHPFPSAISNPINVPSLNNKEQTTIATSISNKNKQSHFTISGTGKDIEIARDLCTAARNLKQSKPEVNLSWACLDNRVNGRIIFVCLICNRDLSNKQGGKVITEHMNTRDHKQKLKPGNDFKNPDGKFPLLSPGLQFVDTDDKDQGAATKSDGQQTNSTTGKFFLITIDTYFINLVRMWFWTNSYTIELLGDEIRENTPSNQLEGGDDSHNGTNHSHGDHHKKSSVSQISLSSATSSLSSPSTNPSSFNSSTSSIENVSTHQSSTNNSKGMATTGGFGYCELHGKYNTYRY